MFKGKYQAAADRLIAYWGGEAGAEHRTRATLRQLEVQVERGIAGDAGLEERWHAAHQTPAEHRRQVGEVLAVLGERDPVVDHLVSVLVPGPIGSLVPGPSYEDFSLRIETNARGNGRIRAESPAGGGSEDFRLPFTAQELDSLVRGMESSVRRSGERHGRPPQRNAPRPAAMAPDELGSRLFQALFRGTVRDRWVASLAHARERNQGLRLRLVFAQGDEMGLSPVLALPWELIRNPETGDYVSRDLYTPLVRFLDVSRFTVPAPATPPLRVLLVASSPKDKDPLDLAREHEQIASSWSELPGVKVETVEPTLTHLRQRLRDVEYHVVHFMGHGNFTDEGELLFETTGGMAQPVAARVFAAVLGRIPSLRLVVLNACSSGELPRRQGLDPYSGVASALVAQGLLAVLAMQFPISDDAAITFSETLYCRLAAGDPLEAAVAEGRLAIYCNDADSLEWATPVLYLRDLDRSLIQGLIPGRRSGRDDGRVLPRQARDRGARTHLAATGGSTTVPVPGSTDLVGGPAPLGPARDDRRVVFHRLKWAGVAALGVGVLLLLLVYGPWPVSSLEDEPLATQIRRPRAGPSGEMEPQVAAPSDPRTDPPTKDLEPTDDEPAKSGPDPGRERARPAEPVPPGDPAPDRASDLGPTLSEAELWPRGVRPGEVRRNDRDGLGYVWIPKGRFRYGCSPGDDECEDDEEPAVDQKFEHGFWLGRTEVTVGAYRRFRGHPSLLPPAPSFNPDWRNEAQPMVKVSRAEAASFCQWATTRLPTEIEWEYAARGGERRALPPDLSARAWFADQSDGRAHAVSQKEPNGFGLYDMLGNVSEWVAPGPQEPAGSGILRGGSWRHGRRYLRFSFRLREGSSESSEMYGFRCLADS